MSKRLRSMSSILIVFLLLVGCRATPLKITHEIENNIEKLVSVLCDEELEGRLTGTEGNRMAMEIIEDEYRKLELIPVGEEEYRQTYEHELIDVNSQLSYSTNDEIISLDRGIDYIERLVYPTCISAKIDVQDKDIGILTEEGHRIGTIREVENFMYSVIPSKDRLILQMKPKAYSLIEEEPDGTLTYESQLDRMNIKVSNLIGKLETTGMHDKALVISAHFDGAGMLDDTVYPSALDNASGVAVMLEIAKVLKGWEPQSMDVLFIAINGEEQGLKGSKELPEYLSKDYDHIEVINIDCIGNAEDTELIAVSQNPISDGLIFHVREEFSKKGIPLSLNSEYRSDHESFEESGIPSFTLGGSAVKQIHTPDDTVDRLDYSFMNRVALEFADFIKLYASNEEVCNHDVGRGSRSFNNDRELNEMDAFLEQEKMKLSSLEATVVVYDGVNCYIANDELTGSTLGEINRGMDFQLESILSEEWKLGSVAVKFGYPSGPLDVGVITNLVPNVDGVEQITYRYLSTKENDPVKIRIQYLPRVMDENRDIKARFTVDIEATKMKDAKKMMSLIDFNALPK